MQQITAACGEYKQLKKVILLSRQLQEDFTVSKIRCRVCGEMIPEGSRFCTYCGCSIPSALSPEPKESGAKKGGRIALVIICILVIIAGLGFVGYKLLPGVFHKAQKNAETVEETAYGEDLESAGNDRDRWVPLKEVYYVDPGLAGGKTYVISEEREWTYDGHGRFAEVLTRKWEVDYRNMTSRKTDEEIMEVHIYDERTGFYIMCEEKTRSGSNDRWEPHSKTEYTRGPSGEVKEIKSYKYKKEIGEYVLSSYTSYEYDSEGRTVRENEHYTQEPFGIEKAKLIDYGYSDQYGPGRLETWKDEEELAPGYTGAKKSMSYVYYDNGDDAEFGPDGAMTGMSKYEIKEGTKPGVEVKYRTIYMFTDGNQPAKTEMTTVTENFEDGRYTVYLSKEYVPGMGGTYQEYDKYGNRVCFIEGVGGRTESEFGLMSSNGEIIETSGPWTGLYDLTGNFIEDKIAELVNPDAAPEEPVAQAETETSESAATEAPAEQQPAANTVTLTGEVVDVFSMAKIPVIRAEASSELNNYEGRYSVNRLLDGDYNTTWQEGVPGFGEGESITLYTDPDREIKYIAMWAGHFKSEEMFRKNGRLAKIRVEISDGQSFELGLNDVMVPVAFAFSEPVHTEFIKITILEVYPGSAWKDTAIAEIQLY